VVSTIGRLTLGLEALEVVAVVIIEVVSEDHDPINQAPYTGIKGDVSQPHSDIRVWAYLTATIIDSVQALLSVTPIAFFCTPLHTAMMFSSM
jgi:hypothetical protein